MVPTFSAVYSRGTLWVGRLILARQKAPRALRDLSPRLPRSGARRSAELPQPGRGWRVVGVGGWLGGNPQKVKDRPGCVPPVTKPGVYTSRQANGWRWVVRELLN